jgi:hypothetical protein
MYKLLEKLFLSVLFVCILISCRKQTESDILSGQTFEDVLLRAEKEQKYLCLVLIDSGQHNAMDLLKNQLNGEFKSLKKKTVFNIVDIYAGGNRWYEKWLCPVSVPLTCVFSPDGTLLNLIPDLTYESFAYMKKTVEDGQTDNEYYCYNRFGMNKKGYVDAMNSVLLAKRKFETGDNLRSLIDTSLEQVKYPFNLFLKMKNEERLQDSVNMVHACRELLAINTPYELLLYKEEFTESKKVLDPSYDITKDPCLEVMPVVVEIGQCEYHERKPFFIVLKNTGDKPVKISTVETSCSCVSFLGREAQYIILPHDSVQMPFEFYAEQKGEIERGCYFVSDARNPVVDVKILATVRSEQAIDGK